MTDANTAEASELPSLKRGAVAIIDALGFKGIWKKRDPALVLAALQKTKAFANTMHRVGTAIDSRITIRLAFFSDTVVIVTTRSASGGELKDFELVIAAIGHAASVISSGIEGELHLSYRGCIALGGVATLDEFFVGPAIDEAAEWYERANAAAIWLTPSASEAMASGYGKTDGLFFEWPVPIKCADPIQTLVVNPLWFTTPDPITSSVVVEADEAVRRILATFDTSRPGVLDKLQETTKLLTAAVEHTRREWASSEELPPEARAYILRKLQQLAVGKG